jgi:outer membrane receptor protein involved in Fe transport
VGAPEQGSTVDGRAQKIGSYYTIDLQLSYEFGKGKAEGRSWYDGTRLTVGCRNVNDAEVPFIAGAGEDNTDKNNYDLLGRFAYFEIAKRF